VELEVTDSVPGALGEGAILQPYLILGRCHSGEREERAEYRRQKYTRFHRLLGQSLQR